MTSRGLNLAAPKCWTRWRHGRRSRLVVRHAALPGSTIVASAGLVRRDVLFVLLVPRSADWWGA